MSQILQYLAQDLKFCFVTSQRTKNSLDNACSPMHFLKFVHPLNKTVCPLLLQGKKNTKKQTNKQTKKPLGNVT